MAAHYGIALIPHAHVNALNVVYALWKGEDPAESMNLSRMANASGDPNQAPTHWLGGSHYTEQDLPVIQNLAGSMPAAAWPVQAFEGPVSQLEAEAAAAELLVFMGTAPTYSSALAQQTLATAMGALDLKFCDE